MHRTGWYGLTALIVIWFTACSTTVPDKAEHGHRAAPDTSSAAALARAFVEGKRQHDSEWLAQLVHPASRAYYRRTTVADTMSYETSWLQGGVPEGPQQVSVTRFVSASGVDAEPSYRAGSLLFIYPVAPSHNLLISIITAAGGKNSVANHAIRRERGRWYIVLPSHSRLLRE